MAVGREQRQRQQPDAGARGAREEKDEKELQRLEEGQEITAEQAQQLQPQLGNAALATLLARAAPTAASTGLGQEEEQAEELVEELDEELQGGELEAPLFGGGGGSGGAGGSGDPWDMGRLFGGDGDDDGGEGGGINPRVRPSPVRQAEGLPEEDEAPPAAPARVEEAHHEAVAAVLPPREPAAARWGDCQHRTVEEALADPRSFGRPQDEPEARVDRGGVRDPLGRPLAIARFLSRAGDAPAARGLGRTLARGAAALLPPAAGGAAGAARLASLAVCVQVAEAEGTGADPRELDRAVALALAEEAWPLAVQSARRLARRRRLHAPQIAARALGELPELDEPPGLGELPHRLGGQALAGLLPASPRLHIPEPLLPALARFEADETLAAVDAVLALLTGAADPRELPPDPLLDREALQPVLDAATALVNALGRCQVEFAAAGIAACRVQPAAPVRAALVHGDRALRLLAADIVAAGDALVAMTGRPRAGLGPELALQLRALRGAVASLEALRDWVLDRVAAAAVRASTPTTPPPPLPAQQEREAGHSGRARALLQAELDRAPRAELALLLGGLLVELGDPEAAAAALGRACALATDGAWEGLAARAALLGLQQRAGDPAALDTARGLLALGRQRGHWLAVVDGSIALAAIHQARGESGAALAVLLDAAGEAQAAGVEAGAVLVRVRLAELRSELGAEAFGLALAEARGP